MLRSVLDAIPSLLFVVDDDVKIQDYNAAAAELLSVEKPAVLQRRGGDVLHCIHATDVPEGCGRASFCKHCIIRNSVAAASQGNRIVRKRTKIEIVRDGNIIDVYALITASPFRYNDHPLTLLAIEDISEIAEFRRMMHICCVCKRIRDEKSWSRLEAYFKEHWDVEFSHGLCPECSRVEMDKLQRDIKCY